MNNCRLRCLPLMLLCAGGCLWGDQDKRPNRNIQNRVIATPTDQLPRSSAEIASRVDSLGGQIVAANPDIGFRPAFICIGVPDVTTFHRGKDALYVSDGLVAKCKTDAELAAVLCSELGKMAAEAQLQGPVVRMGEREPPESQRIGSDIVGGNGDPTQTYLAEQANFEKRNPRSRATTVAPISQDPNVLARSYLTKAGFSTDDLTRATPLLRQAEANPEFEKRLTGTGGNGLGIPNQTK